MQSSTHPHTSNNNRPQRTMAPLKVLISGAGIAGNALAFWLTKLGHDVTVIERFASLRTNGLQIDLRGHGIEVLKRMGLEPAFRAKCAPEQGMQVVDKRGKQRAFFPANKTGQGTQNFTSEYEIMRGDLCQLLFDASKAKTKFVFGDCVERFKNMEDGVEVRFKDGKKEIFDLLVGADGVGSQTRKVSHHTLTLLVHLAPMTSSSQTLLSTD